MLIASITDDRKWIALTSTIGYESMGVRAAFTKKIPDWFRIKRMFPEAIVDECFMSDDDMIPFGLWAELIKACDERHLELRLDKEYHSVFMDDEFDENDFREYVKDLFSKNDEGMFPYDYQIIAAINVLRYRRCSIEITTSGGKTLVAYLIFRYLHDRSKAGRAVYITPSANLATQSAEKWIKYDRHNHVATDWTYSVIHSKAKKLKKYDQDIVFGTFQSLRNKKAEFFKDFDIVFEDEAHHGKATSLKTITRYCACATYKIGMTGTFPKDDSFESFVIQSTLGPIVFRKSSYELINEDKLATPVFVKAVLMEYAPAKDLSMFYTMRRDKPEYDNNMGGQIMNLEKEYARDNSLRTSFISRMIRKTTKNTLVIFTDIKTQYGFKMYNSVKDNTTKSVYYIDGNTDHAVRDDIKECMEEDLTGNTIIFASIGCFSEGIDICNLWNIFLIESTKSDNMLAQLLGRGMRVFDGKDKTVMIDFIDDFRYHGGDEHIVNNYLYMQGLKRLSIYEKRGFPVDVISIDLRQPSLF